MPALKDKNRSKRKTFYYIYKIHFLCGFPTGRYYIGKRAYTGSGIDKDRYTGSGNFCEAYFKKYGKIEGETYIKEILEINPSRKINNDRESFWIGDLWKVDPLCMNQKPGGEGGCGKGKASSRWGQHHTEESKKKISESNKGNCARAVKQYDMDGNLIKVHNSIADAAKEIGLSNGSAITQCCKRTEHYNQAGGYFWRFEDDNVLDFESTVQKYEKQKSITKERRQKEREIAKENKERNKPFIIDQYDLEGNYITSYKTAQSAVKACGGVSSQGITHCCDGDPLYKKAFGYIWRWHGDPLGDTNTTNACIKKVIQCDLNGKEIKCWDSVASVERELNIHHSSISMCCNNKRNHAGGYKWKYVNND